MQDLKEIHKTLEEKRKEAREIGKMFRDELKNNKEYQDVLDEIKTLREKKKSIEAVIQAASAEAANKLDVLKIDIKNFTELLSDVAINKYAANESIEIVDDANVRWIPSFAVKFKKEEGEPLKAPARESVPETPIISFGDAAATA